MSDVNVWSITETGGAGITLPVAVSVGGTGATDVATARDNLSVYAKSEIDAKDALLVSKSSNTGAALIPAGTTSERTPGVIGEVRYNKTIGGYEGYYPLIGWASLATTSEFAVSVEHYTAIAGQTNFNVVTSSYVPDNGSMQVFINGLKQEKAYSYSEVSGQVVFTEGLAVGDEVDFIFNGAVALGVDSANSSFIQAGTGAVTRTAQEKMRESVSAADYGVSPANSAAANDTGFAKAVAAIIAMGGGEIELGVGNHQISYPIALDTGLYTRGIALVGKGRNTIITQTGTGQDVIKFSTTQFLQNSYLKNLQLVAGATSGHVVNIVYGCTCCYFDNVEMVQNNPAKALIYGDWTSFGGGVFDTKFRGGSWYCHASSTEAGVRIKANGTIFNENIFENVRCYNANFLQFFHITTNTTASIWLTNNTLRNINFEVCKGGGVLATSAKGWTLQNLNFWDAGGAYTNHLIDFVAGSGYESASNVLMNISRNGDSLTGGVNDIRILSGQDTTIINCYTSGSPVYDFGGKRVTVIGPLAGTINNKTAMLWLGSQFGGIQFPGSINGSLLNYYDEGTFTATLTGTVTPPTVPVTTVARWTRIGRQVSVEGIFPAANTTGASGNVSITGLPFAVGAVPTIATIAISGLGTDAAVGVASNGTTSITLVKAADITAGITMVAGTNKYVYFSLQYTV